VAAPKTTTARGDLCIRAGKRKGGNTGGGGGGGGGGAKTGGGGSGMKSPGKVKEGSAYQTETRKIILSLSKVGLYKLNPVVDR
jgi:hypothetical protein